MKKKILVLIIALVSVISLCSFKANNEENENIYLQNELKNIYDSFISSLPEGVPRSAEDIMGTLGVKETFSWLRSALCSKSNLRALSLFIAVSLLLSLTEIFASDMASGSSAARSAAAVILSVPILNVMRDAISEVALGISSSSELFSGIIPALTGILAIAGGGAAASVSGTALSFSLGFVTSVLSGALLPLSSMIFSLSMLSSLDSDGITTNTARGIRGIFNFLIGLSSLVIVGVLGAQTVIAVSTDNLAIKSAKYALSGMIPVVGGTVSGALSTIISGVKLLSGTVGSVSAVALVTVVASPLIRLLFLRFCLFLAITVSSFSGGAFAERFFTSVRGALDTLIAVLVSSSLIYLLEIVIVTASVRGAI